jgi:hypothetical protein
MFPMRLRCGRSAVDSDSDSEPMSGSCARRAPDMIGTFSFEGQDWGDPLVYNGDEDIVLEPNVAVMLPVRRISEQMSDWTGSEAVVVIQGHPIQVVPGIWEAGLKAGSVLVMNDGFTDFSIAYGDSVGCAVPVALQTRECFRCGCIDTDSWVRGSAEDCAQCGQPLAGGPSTCREC